ncbi:MAG: hypothetical protein QNJ55_03590 [Xenococcus sp. MO_188.B8]|nr:hypothetical protein [Xenococcus sp. MO_188.B8]
MDTREYYPENNRIKVLNSLVEFLEPLDLLSDKLKKLSWDYSFRNLSKSFQKNLRFDLVLKDD